MSGVPLYYQNQIAVAPFMMMYFTEPEHGDKYETDVNSLTFFKSEKNLFEGKVMSQSKLRSILLDPEHHGWKCARLKMVDEQGRLRAGHLPLLEDLFGYSPVFQIMLRNEIQRMEDKSSVFVIPPRLTRVVDLVPQLDFTRPIFVIGNLPISVCLGSYTNGFQVNQIFSNLQVIDIKVIHNTLSGRYENGVMTRPSRRYHEVRIIPVYADKFVFRPNPLKKGTKIIVWNAKGVARDSFTENFKALFVRYQPIVYVMTEARVSQSNMEWVRSKLGSRWGSLMTGEFDVAGGVVIIFDKVQLKVLDCLPPDGDGTFAASVMVQALKKQPTVSREYTFETEVEIWNEE